MRSTSNMPSSTLPFNKDLIFEYIAVVKQRWQLLLFVVCSIFIGVALYTFLMKPIYEAYATLYVKDVTMNGGLMGSMMPSAYNPLNAELEILTSRTISEQVVKRLHLNWQIEKKSKDLNFKIMEFSSAAEGSAYRIELNSADTFTVNDNNGKHVGEGKTGSLMQVKDFSLLLNDLSGKKGDSFMLRLLPLNDVAMGLCSAIKAVEKKKETSVIRVSYTNTDPVLARDIINVLIQSYLEQGVSLKAEEANKTVIFLDKQLQEQHKDLDSSEKNLQAYKTSSGVIKLDDEAKDIIAKISEMEKARTDIALQKKQTEFAIDSLNSTIRKGSTYSPSIMKDDPVLAEMAGKLSDLEVQKRALLIKYTDNHPVVKAIQMQIDEIQKKIRSTYENKLINLTIQQDAIAHQLSVYEKKMRNLPEEELDLARLTRYSSVNANIYTFLLQKHEEARIARASTNSNIDIIDSAIVPGAPILPDKKKNLLLGLLFGCILGFGIIFLLDYMDDTIKDAEEAKRIMGLPLLGVIPHVSELKLEKNSHSHQSIFTNLEKKSNLSESFRSLRTNLHFFAINKAKKIILITSSFPAEGKSFISINLSNTIAQIGSRVLLMDCDLRRSSLHTKLCYNKSPGLSELLTGDATLAEIKHSTEIPGLDLITAGTTPPNPSELLGSEAMRQFLIEQRENYDYIILDAPPVMAVTDAPVLTAVVDMTVLVMQMMRVPVKLATQMRDILTTIKAPIAGLVINYKTEAGYTGRYYRYGSNYGYGYYSDEDEPMNEKLPWLKNILLFWKKQ